MKIGPTIYSESFRFCLQLLENVLVINEHHALRSASEKKSALQLPAIWLQILANYQIQISYRPRCSNLPFFTYHVSYIYQFRVFS